MNDPAIQGSCDAAALEGFRCLHKQGRIPTEKLGKPLDCREDGGSDSR